MRPERMDSILLQVCIACSLISFDFYLFFLLCIWGNKELVRRLFACPCLHTRTYSTIHRRRCACPLSCIPKHTHVKVCTLMPLVFCASERMHESNNCSACMCACMLACVCAHINIHVQKSCTYTCTDVHTCIHTHIPTYIHTSNLCLCGTINVYTQHAFALHLLAALATL